jgi:hypothetical protein
MTTIWEWRYRMRERSRRRILQRIRSGKPLDERQLRRMALLTLTQWGIVNEDQLGGRQRVLGGFKASRERAW